MVDTPQQTQQALAEQFAEQMGIADDTDQFAVMVEEVGEFAEAQLTGDQAAIREELADVLVTARVMAVIHDVDLDAAYREKMHHNLSKSGARDGGKLRDDVDSDARAGQ